jgi:C-terminal processing protease CtpA/Prc
VRTRGQVFARYVHNDLNVRRDQVLRFEEAPAAPAFDRLIVISTRASASASELVVNALRPFIPVVIIGDRTYGKPVGQYQVNFCDRMLAPVAFTVRNANGEGDYFEGLAPDCAAPDDVEREIGDPEEGSLREALRFVETGSCTQRPQGLQRRTEARREHRARGWQSVVNAY